MFSKACEYGIRSILFIASKSKDDIKVGIKGIAYSLDIPEAFTGKVLQQLVRAEILSSSKGKGGGFFLTQEQLRNKTLGDIVKSIDGDLLFEGCGLGLAACNAHKPCPLHTQFVKIRKELKSVLQDTTIEKLSDDLVKGITFLKR